MSPGAAAAAAPSVSKPMQTWVRRGKKRGDISEEELRQMADCFDLLDTDGEKSNSTLIYAQIYA